MTKDVEDLYVEVTLSLSSHISVSPNYLTNLKQSTSVPINITVTLDSSTNVGVYGGVIQLRDSSNTIAKPLNVKIKVVEKDFGSIPPDPDVEGEKTIEGIDSDNDGLRDDVQRYIMITYPERKLLQKALFEYAKQYQVMLQVADNKEESRQAANDIRARHQCVSSVVKSAYKYLRKLSPIILNTSDRNRRYILFNEQLSGYISNSHKDRDMWHTSCNFDVNGIEE